MIMFLVIAIMFICWAGGTKVHNTSHKKEIDQELTGVLLYKVIPVSLIAAFLLS